MNMVNDTVDWVAYSKAYIRGLILGLPSFTLSLDNLTCLRFPSLLWKVRGELPLPVTKSEDLCG